MEAREIAARPPLQVILGPCDDMRAEVFVRASAPGTVARLEGHLAGPECRRSLTLPAGATLGDLGSSGAGLLARAVLTEPAFWTPELPNLYLLSARLVAAGRTVAEATRWIGLRRSGVRGRSLWLEGRRWVPRGVACHPDAQEVETLRAAGVAAVVRDPPDPLLTAADEAGLAIIAVAEPADGGTSPADTVVERIRGWAMHPSVMVAILPESCVPSLDAEAAAAFRRLKGTMIVAAVACGASPPPGGVPAGIDCLCVALDAGRPPHDAWREAPPVPLLAWRRSAGDAATDRSGCDRLQAELAAWGLAAGGTHRPWDWAGYLAT